MLNGLYYLRIIFGCNQKSCATAGSKRKSLTECINKKIEVDPSRVFKKNTKRTLYVDSHMLYSKVSSIVATLLGDGYIRGQKSFRETCVQKNA